MNIASLSQYAKHKDGTYVALEMSQESKDMLDNYVEMNLGLSERVNKNTYHITVIYSRTPVPSAEALLHMNTSIPVEAQPVGYEIFPTKNDGYCLVLRIICPYATRINSQLTREGATSDYTEYKPHITLAYDIKEKVDVSTLPVPQFQLVFDVLKVEPLDPQYTPENAK
jgi:2'-5' RNA ligase